MSTQGSHRSLSCLMVGADAPLREVLRRQSEAVDHGLPAGIVLVVDGEGALQGTVTDGDVRRALVRTVSLEVTAGEAMTGDPIVFVEGTSFRAILRGLPAELEKRGRRSRRFLGKIVLVDDRRRPTRVLDYHQLWEQRVATHRHIVVVGMGYVGLTLALVLAEEGFHVTGVDVDEAKVSSLAAGRSHVHENRLPELLREELGRNFKVSTELPAGGDVFVLAVGTPVRVDETPPVPQLDTLVQSAERVGAQLRPGGLVVLRSTVPLGTTRESVLPVLERVSGLRAGMDFHLSFAPERTAEGRALQELRQLPQIIGGVNDDSVEATAALFRELTPTIVRMESLEAAELAKLVNNGFRDLIFAFSNQIAQLAAPYGFDVVEAILAANRAYPRDPVPLPSPGVGGPCLTKDPYILATAAARAGLGLTLCEHGRKVNESMLGFVSDAVMKQLEGLGKNLADCRVLVCGLAFKGNPETGDLRLSSGVEIAQRIRPRVGTVYGHDAVASPEEVASAGLTPVDLPEGFEGCDAVLFLNNHRCYEVVDVFSMVRSMRSPGVVYDGWHLFHPEDVTGASPCVYMGLGFSRSSVAVEGPPPR